MYAVGVLFGLGFDTATEICLLGLAALQGCHGVSPWYILLLPCVFTAGMCLLDTADGVLMLGVYGSSDSITPAQKVGYHVAVTAVSCLFAFFISVLEVLGIVQSEYSLAGPFWDAIGSGNSGTAFGVIGCAMLGVFLAGWGASWAIHRRRAARRCAAADALGLDDDSSNVPAGAGDLRLAPAESHHSGGRSTADSAEASTKTSGVMGHAVDEV